MTAAERRIVTEDAEAIANAPLNWHKLKGKTILISGANGYVPQYFVHGFLKKNDLEHFHIKVIALCRSKERADLRFSEYSGRTDFELLLQDVCLPLQYKGKVDYIIHAASPAGKTSRYDDPAATFDANVMGSRNLLEFAQEKNAEYLQISSVDVYGTFFHSNRLTEDDYGTLDPLSMRNVYSCSKSAAETLCSCYSLAGTACKIVRPFQILAGGIGLDDGRLHSDFISQLLKGDTITLKGDGTPRRSFLYITDAIAGMLTVMLEGRNGEAYNLCAESGEASVLELAQIMISHVTDRNIKILYDMEARTKDQDVTDVISVVCGCSEKLRSLGWEPKVSLGEACKRMMVFYGVVKG